MDVPLMYGESMHVLYVCMYVCKHNLHKYICAVRIH